MEYSTKIKIINTLKVSVIGIALLLPLSGSAAAIYRYTYTGALEYELVTPGMPVGVGQITGYIDLAAPMQFGVQDIAPIAYSFTDGVTTITEQSGYQSLMTFVLDDEGAISDYWVYLEYELTGLAEPDRHINLVMNTYEVATTYCPQVCTPENYDFYGEVAFTTGFDQAGIPRPYWTASVIPIPAAVWLFGSALGLLGWLRRKQTA